MTLYSCYPLSKLSTFECCRNNGANPRGMRNNEPVLFALKETMRYGFFLGTFAGAFCTVDEAIAAAKGCRRSGRSFLSCIPHAFFALEALPIVLNQSIKEDLLCLLI